MKIKPSQPRSRMSSGARRRRAMHARALRARRVTAQRLLASAHLQASLWLDRQMSPWMGCIAGLQVARAVLAAIVPLRHSLWPHLVGFAALGALAAIIRSLCAAAQMLRHHLNRPR